MEKVTQYNETKKCSLWTLIYFYDYTPLPEGIISLEREKAKINNTKLSAFLNG